MAKHKFDKKRSKIDRAQPKEGPQQKPERQQETQLEPEQMGNIFVPDRSGVSNIRDRGR